MSIVFRTPIMLTGSVADIRDPYAKEIIKGNGYIFQLYIYCSNSY